MLTARRVVAEHRALVMALGVVLVLNAVGYAAFVFPLSRRVGSVAERTQAAENELAAARAEHARAAAALEGKDRAREELERFYTTVLPADFGTAVRLAQPRLAQLARDANLHDVRTKATPQEDDELALTRLQIDMNLTGSYPAVRRFIDQLERVSDFVVVDHVRLSEATYQESELIVQLELSTYYRNGAE
jgi:Tfp pilus assembly protein PilO